jgi:DNA-binding GntR family transcriptional regulator
VLNRANLAAQAYEQLRADLMAGCFEPGQKLKLRDIAATLGVSVTPVREALARLVSDQALVQDNHRSVRVPMLDRARFDELRELRLELEGWSAAQAARAATEADIAALEAIHHQLLVARSTGSHANILLANQRFHLRLCAASGMPVLVRLIEALWLQCGPLMHGMSCWPVERPVPHPHTAIVAALQARDPDAARRALRQDIMMSTDAIWAYLSSHAERPNWAKDALGETRRGEAGFGVREPGADSQRIDAEGPTGVGVASAGQDWPGGGSR